MTGVVSHPDNGIGQAIILVDDHGGQEVGGALLGDALLGCPSSCSLQGWCWATWLECWARVDESVAVDEPAAVEVELLSFVDRRQGELVELLELRWIDESSCPGGLLLFWCWGSVLTDALWSTVDNLLDSSPNGLVLGVSRLADPGVVADISIALRTPASGPAPAPALGNLWGAAHFQDPSPLPVAAPSVTNAEV